MARIDKSEGGLLSEGSSVSTPQGATSQSAADQINAEIAGARAATPADAATQAREGGALSHAGIVSREYGIPCVVGTGQATSTLVDGQVVEVDARRPTGLVAVLG